MPLFIFINNININNSSYIIKELKIREVNKDAIKYTIITFIKFLDFIPKE